MNGFKTSEIEQASGIQVTGEALGIVEVGNDLSPVQIVGTQSIRETFGQSCIQQAIAARLSPGVSHMILNPDAHYGYGVPVGSVVVSPDHIYPGPVGVDIKCSMSLLQTDIPEEAIQEKSVRRQIIQEIASRLASARRPPKGRAVNEATGFDAAVYGAKGKLLDRLGIPPQWRARCEHAQHTGLDESHDTLAVKLEKHIRNGTVKDFQDKCKQLGSYGGGNHFGECEVVRVNNDPHSKKSAEVFGLRDGKIAFLSHCGSRGLGHALATHQFRSIQSSFRKRGWSFPSGDPELCYVEHGSPLAEEYLIDMALGANFATVNHLLINAIVLAAFQKVIPGSKGELVYFISHNLATRERMDDQWQWVHRKGATRAFPAGHPELSETIYAETGHPILLPGNPRDGSSIMVAQPGASLTAYSINHGAGRKMSRTMAKASLNANQVRDSLDQQDILSNCRHYPIDEAPDAYKDFNEVLRSVELAGLAKEVARLQARFVIKDAKGSRDD